MDEVIEGASAPEKYADTVAEALRVLASPNGILELEGRSRGGVGVVSVGVAPRDLEFGLPEALLRGLADEFTFSARVVLRSGASTGAMQSLVVRWRLETAFDPRAEPACRRHVTPDAYERLAATLRAMPAASLIVDAASEVWAAWRLVTPVAHLPTAAAAMATAATALGAEVFTDLGTAAVPVAGPVKSWNYPAPPVCVVSVRSDVTYELGTLVETITKKETAHAGTTETDERLAGRRARSRG